MDDERDEQARNKQYQAFVRYVKWHFPERALPFLRYLSGLSSGAFTLRDIARELGCSRPEARQVIDKGIQNRVMERYYTYWKVSRKAMFWLWQEGQHGNI
jgi:hypothetical protein